jgi:hypothetical protein
MSQPKHPGVRPIFRLNGERKSWDRLYDCTEPSCLEETSKAFWWLREREPWKRISAEIAAEATVLVVLQSSDVAVRTRLAHERASARDQRETRH